MPHQEPYIYRMNTVINDENTIVLTKKQVNIVELLSKGGTAATVGKKLKVSPRTVEDVVRRLKTMYNCKTQGHLLCQFIRLGIIK